MPPLFEILSQVGNCFDQLDDSLSWPVGGFLLPFFQMCPCHNRAGLSFPTVISMFRYLQQKQQHFSVVEGDYNDNKILFLWHNFGVWLLTQCCCHDHPAHLSLHTFELSVGVIRKEKKNPPSPLTNVFCLKWGFLGARWDVTVSWMHSWLTRPQSQPEVLYGPAAFWTYYVKGFFFFNLVYIEPIVLIFDTV